MDKKIVMFTMDGCPFCKEAKKKLKNSGIDFYERDIHKFKHEYQLFVNETKNEYVPAFVFLEYEDMENIDSTLLAPDRDFNTIDEVISKAEKFLLK